MANKRRRLMPKQEQLQNKLHNNDANIIHYINIFDDNFMFSAS